MNYYYFWRKLKLMKITITFLFLLISFISFNQNIKKKYDKFSEETTYSTPLFGKGVIILFTDGTKLEYPANISVSVNSGANYDYSSFLTLDEAAMKLFSEKTVEGFKLYIYEGKFLTKRKAEKFRINVGELLKSN